MSEPSALARKFKIFQKVKLIDWCSEQLIYYPESQQSIE